MKYEELSKQLLKQVLSEYNNRPKWDKRSLSTMLDEHLVKFNKEAQKLIEQDIYDNLNTMYFPAGNVPLVATSVELSSMLYKNAKETNVRVTKILADGNKAKETIQNISKKIYEGYNSEIDNLDINEDLPKYLKENRDALKQINKLKDSPLKYSYKKVLEKMNDINAKGFDEAINVALQERARYYATRIAKTEAHRSQMVSRAKEYLEDKDVELVRFEMSASHPRTDICDFYASLDVGFGRGVVPKSEMRVLPLHPHCKCVYSPYYGKVNKNPIKSFKQATNETMSRFSVRDRRDILGSREKLDDFNKGEDIEGIFNRVRPKYKVTNYVDVL